MVLMPPDPSVRCPECIAAGSETTIYRVLGTDSRQCLWHDIPVSAYTDTKGRKHWHDPRCCPQHYACAANHEWQVIGPHRCWCGWEWKVRRCGPETRIVTEDG